MLPTSCFVATCRPPAYMPKVNFHGCELGALLNKVRIEFDIEREDGPRDLLNVAEATCCS